MFIHALWGSDLSPTCVDSRCNLVPHLLHLLESFVLCDNSITTSPHGVSCLPTRVQKFFHGPIYPADKP